MAKKAVLGRGLSALLPSERYSDASDGTSEERSAHHDERPSAGDPGRSVGRVADVLLESIQASPYQPRRDFDEEALHELAHSIRQLGIIQPITVRAVGNDRYELISGERRLRAARLAGLQSIPAYIRKAGTEEVLEMAIVENIQREDLNPIEIAIGYQRLIEECGLTQESVADKVGKNRTTVTNMLRLLRLPPAIQAYLRDGSLSAGHARMLVTVEDPSFQSKLAADILDNQLSVRDVERLVRDWHRKALRGSEPEKVESKPGLRQQDDKNSLQLRSFTDQLRSHYSTQVNIKHKSDGSGKIEISYFTESELERLLEMLMPG